MRRFTWMMALAAGTTLLAVACGDDETTPPPNPTTTGATTTSGGDGGGGMMAGTGGMMAGTGGMVAGTGGMMAGTGGTGGGAGGAPPVHGCAEADFVDMTGTDPVQLQWSNPHDQCIIADIGATITFTGSFVAHPLAGGVSPTEDAGSQFSMADQSGASADVSFGMAGDWPYFCTIHTVTMTGVIRTQ